MAAYYTAVLVGQAGAFAGKEIALDRDTVTIGRALDNEVVLDDEQVSRHHANIRRQGDQFVLTDLASANGTFVNRVRITEPHVLRSGEMIQVGATVLELRSTAAAAATVISPPSEQTVVGRPPAPAPPPPRYAPAPPPQPAYTAPPTQPAYVPPPAPAPARPARKKGGIGGWCGCLIVLIIIFVSLFILAVAGYLFAVMFALLPDTFGILPMLGLQPGTLF